MRVQTGDKVMIGGFIITGSASKNVAIRALGPSLRQAGLVDVLNDPILELRGSDGSLLSENDNWKDDSAAASQLQARGFALQNDLESAIVATLAPGAYTATLRGKNETTGNALVEVYDLDQGANCELANISTRGSVQAGDSVMIGGFILGGQDRAKILIRALGPSLAEFGVAETLSNPALELRDANGAVLQRNQNWRETQETAIRATGLPPGRDAEAAMVADLTPGAYTAIVSGEDGGGGVALVEIFNLP